MLLRVGEWEVEVDESLAQLALSRCDLGPFVSRGAPRLRLTRSAQLDEGLPFEGGPVAGSAYQILGDEIRVRIVDEPSAAEAAIRIAYQLGFIRQGAVMIHGSGVDFGGPAVVATGQSGAGKSTLAELCVAQVGAALLSDEIMALMPGGLAYGTPFRSDSRRPGAVGPARLSSVLLLEQGKHESLAEVEQAEAAGALLSQMFRPLGGELGKAEALRRISEVITTVGVRRLTFRKHAEAARFLKGWCFAQR